MKKTRLSAVASLLSAGVLMGGCMADFGGESKGGEAVGEAKQALQAPMPGTWTDWQRLPLTDVVAEKSPAISSRGNGTFDVFVLGSDQNIYMKSYASGRFGPWANLGAPAGRTFVSGPDAVSSDANSFAIVAMADNGHYYLNTWTDASGSAVMSGWQQIMGKGLTNGPSHGPGLSSFGQGRLAVYGFGPDSQTWESRQDPAAEWGWSLQSLGSPQNAPLASSVTSVSWNSSKVDLFVRGSDNSLWTRGGDATGWTPQNDWRKLGGQFTSGFGAASWGFGHLDVFGVGDDSKLYQIQYEAGWSAFTPVEAPLVGLAGDAAPDAVSSGRGRIDLIVRGKDNQPWVRSFTSSTGGIRRSPPVASGSLHSLAVKSDGTLWAWGRNDFGQLGDGMAANRSTPGQVPNLTGVVSVAAGYSHSLAVQSDGTLWAWGWNDDGQLGDGTTTDRSTPVRVQGLTGVVAVAAGLDHSLALKSDGTLWAWGTNFAGQLGNGTQTSSPTPVQVRSLRDVVAVAVGDGYSLAVTRDGTLWAWGWNFGGRLGDGTMMNSSVPKPVLTGVVSVAAYFSHSLAVKSDGTLWAWGNNDVGQLGDGTTTTSLAPKRVLTDVVAVAAGRAHSLALKSDGTLWSWGSNSAGQLGDGTVASGVRSTPKLVNLTGVVAVAAGAHLSMAVKSDGTLWTWGWNSYGQLGDGTTTSRSTPWQLPGLPVRL